MIFAEKGYLFLLLLIIPYIIWYLLHQRKNDASLQVSDTHAYKQAPKSFKIYLLHSPFFLRIASFIFLVIILARPQYTDSWKNSETQGIDIMMTIDVSTSMLSEELHPNRLEAAKEVGAEFINGRPDDNIGLTIFAGHAFTQCPPTVDHTVLLNLFQGVKCGVVDDGTAIGMGIADAVAKLKDSKAKSKIIILLTDGSNNSGDISPLTAAEIAHKFGIRVYTIGVGTNGLARYPMPTAIGTQYVNIPVQIDEKTLRQIASETGGIYYRATNTDKLKVIYQQIDKLEKTKMRSHSYSRREEAYQPFALLLLLCLLLEIVLRNTILKKIP